MHQKPSPVNSITYSLLHAVLDLQVGVLWIGVAAGGEGGELDVHVGTSGIVLGYGHEVDD